MEWYPQPGSKPTPYATEVVRKGKWKMLAYKGQPAELYDIYADPREKINVLDKHPELAKRMAEKLRIWLAEPRKSWLVSRRKTKG